MSYFKTKEINKTIKYKTLNFIQPCYNSIKFNSARKS